MTDAAKVLTEVTALAFRGVLTTGVYCRATCVSRPPPAREHPLVRVRLRRPKSRFSPVPAMPSQ
ncbi:hypothetical protein HQN82_23995 (plasmid) [Agrobacterium pusense]|nr:hypothetical protein HQN82_23995 [Agrobacterium pusense]